ncbi:MAG: OsmC family protein [Ignavibacteriaceae bacterium]
MKEKKLINGINVNRLSEVIDVVGKNPELAKFQFRVKNTWMNGGHSRSIIKGFYSGKREDNTRSEPYIFENDQPLILLGSDKGASPLEYILNSLAACITDSIIYRAALKGVEIKEIESELEGNFDLRDLFLNQDGIEKQDENIEVKIRITANSLAQEEKIAFCESAEKSSPVFNILTKAFPVNISVANKS